MADKIDFKFIGDLEGGSKIKGYVPAVGVSKSGVTIATGFDLGQRNEADLKELKLSGVLIKKLEPFLGIKGKDAKDKITNKPLLITEQESIEIDKSVKKAHIERLKLKFNTASKTKKFDDLSAEQQTIIASVSFQYGTGLDSRAPKLWKALIADDWQEAGKILNDFGDAYPTRRKKEASLLEKNNAK